MTGQAGNPILRLEEGHSASAAAPAPPPPGPRPVFLKNEKRVILAFRTVVALVAVAAFLDTRDCAFAAWQFYFIVGVYVLTNVVFLFEKIHIFDTRRAQTCILLFDIAMISVIMVCLGLRNKEFYLVFLLTIFVSALSRRTAYAFAVSAVMAGLYLIFTLYGKTDVDALSAPFFVRVILFFVVSSFVGHISENAEAAREDVLRLTEWKERVQRVAMEQDKMAAVGLLAAGVAHEFNNLLAGIKGYVDLARMNAMPVGECLDTVSKQCEHAAGIVRDLMSFSRKRGGRIVEVDVGLAVDQVLRLVRKELAAGEIEAETRLAEAPPVRAEEGTVERTILNLVMNSIEAIDKKGKITIEVSPRGSDVVLTVADSGPGMAPEVLARAFEPFFSTKEPKPGTVAHATGLGLAVSRRLVESAGGTIELGSSPGEGTVATVVLPAVALDSPAQAAGGPGAGGAGKS